jgi:septum formation protein
VTPSLVLASSSPTRRAILADAGVRFLVDASGTDETLFDAPTANLVAQFAREKAVAVAPRHITAFVLGCDSLLDIDGQAYGKPGSPLEAERRWQAQRGRSGVLYTGHVLVSTATGEQHAEVVATAVHFGHPTDLEISAYVQSGEPLDKAGALTLEGRSAAFIDSIEGDAGNVRGLSLPALARLLGHHGWSITDFWTDRGH